MSVSVGRRERGDSWEPAAEAAIVLEGLRKVYGRKVAVSHLTLQVERGEVFGFLGPNGAGKTTAIKMMLGLVRPTAGRGWLLGHPLGDWRVRERIGFLPEDFRFHPWLRAAEFLDVHGQLYGMPVQERRQRIPELLELVGLADEARTRLAHFSKGMLQRIGLAQALLNRPDLVFLDEPTSGLDPLGRLLVRDVIHHLREEGTTVFLNSHLLSEVEVTCDRVGFIKAGELVRIADLRRLVEGETEVELRVGEGEATPALLEGLRRLGAWKVQAHDRRVTMTVDKEEKLPEIARWVLDQGVHLYALTPRRLSLEDLFVRIVQDHQEGAR
ncbi:MAG: ABC transporter ATP-binding protein [Chloroflexi bacterium]|nr:MAG: ABC transporter ATP-binding protein [Chloroflexota bacterium]